MNLITFKWKWLKKNINLIILIYKWLNEISNLCILINVLKRYHIIRGKSNMQGWVELPSLVEYLTTYLLDLNAKVSLSLGIMVYDAQRKMLTNVILLYIYRWHLKRINIVIILMMKERKKSSIHYYLLFKDNK